MTEPDSSVVPGTSSLPSKKSNNTLIAVVAAIIILCCCCFGTLGLIIAFWQPILTELGLA